TFGQQIRSVREILAGEDKQYAQVVALYLSLGLAKQVFYNSKAAWWQTDSFKVAPTMARHDIQMTWDYTEANPFSGQAASWNSFINGLWHSIENAVKVHAAPAEVLLGSATRLPSEFSGCFDAVICDPPYYDSITYADLS